MQTQPLPPAPGLLSLFFTLAVIGIQSFGGGSSTFFMIHQACVRRGWLSEDEFVRAWALAQISPGINLLKLTMMFGYRLRGWPGLLAASSGLILPSAAITVLMTAGFSAISGQPVVKAALRGVLPAAIGLSLAMAVQMARPVLARAHREGRARLGAHLAVLIGAALGLAAVDLSPVLILFLSGAATVLALAVLPSREAQPEMEED